MKICVFCASSPLVSEKFQREAHALGLYIAQHKHILVYGGATGGLMDAVAEGAHEGGGEIIGVIPQKIVDAGRQSTLPAKMIVVADLSSRKDTMCTLADMFITLPGGFGTWDETFDVLVSGWLGYHSKHLLLYNCDGYYDGLHVQIERMITENLGYMTRQTRLHIRNTLPECLAWIEKLDSTISEDTAAKNGEI